MEMLTPERIEAYRDQYLLGKDDSGRGLSAFCLSRAVKPLIPTFSPQAGRRSSQARREHALSLRASTKQSSAPRNDCHLPLCSRQSPGGANGGAAIKVARSKDPRP